MAKVCRVCGRGPQVGNTVTTRGKAKYLGGVGTKVTGINRRQFKPNLQRVHVTVDGTNRTIQVCTRCIRTGAITKLIKSRPFRLPSATGAGKPAETPAAKPAKPKAPTASASGGKATVTTAASSGAKAATASAAKPGTAAKPATATPSKTGKRS